MTIAGTDTGKGASQVIPTALTYPGSMVLSSI
ncbi:type IV secretory system conjugative DNA transfer family protein [Celeribacter halophilus]